MKNAEGSDIHKIDLDSEMLALTPRSMEHLHLKKQLANLQVLGFRFRCKGLQQGRHVFHQAGEYEGHHQKYGG